MTPASGDHGRLVLLATSPRVAPGLLGATAWDVVRAASDVRAADDAHPQVAALRAEGVQVRCVGPPDPAALLALAATDTVVWLLEPDGDDDMVTALREVAKAEGPGAPTIEVVAGSHDLPGARLLDLVAVMNRLRSPGGCPWDAEQTHRSLATYLLEETYETLEAIEAGDDADLREELGDLLLQVMFHARIAEERPTQAWSIDDVAAGITSKLIRRHPHVFADADAHTADDVRDRWETLKQAEKQRESAVDGVPLTQPALSLAAKLLHRAEKAGVDVAVAPLPVEGVGPAAELPTEAAASAGVATPADAEVAVGDALLALVATARERGVDPEQALRDAVRRFVTAVRAAEQRGS